MTQDQQRNVQHASAGATYLDPKETNVQQPKSRWNDHENPIYDSEIDFRHRSHPGQRADIMQAYARLGWSQSQIDRYRQCGNTAYVMRSTIDPSKYALRANCCHHRWCPACAAARARTIRKNVSRLIQGRNVRFVTLTLKHVPATLADRLNTLQQCFRRLRRLPIWKDNVTAGVSFTEIKRNAVTRNWHPHLHILTLGNFIHQRLLANAWHAVTGDSHIVDIRYVSDTRKALAYLTKYLTKQTDNGIMKDDDSLDEAIQSLKGRRLITTINAWRGERLLENDPDTTWEQVCSYPELIRRVRNGDPDARNIYYLLTHRTHDAHQQYDDCPHIDDVPTQPP